MVQTAKPFKVTCMALAMLVTGKAATEVANGGFKGAIQLAGLVDPPPLSALMGLGSPGGADNPFPLSAQGPGSLGGGGNHSSQSKGPNPPMGTPVHYNNMDNNTGGPIKGR